MGHGRGAWRAHKWDMGGELGGHINGTWAGSLAGT